MQAKTLSIKTKTELLYFIGHFLHSNETFVIIRRSLERMHPYKYYFSSTGNYFLNVYRSAILTIERSKTFHN